MFSKTPQLLQAVALINRVDEAKFPLLLSRIVQKVNQRADELFTEEEELKLQAALDLKPQELKLLLETLAFVLEQAAYLLAKPAVLSSHLLDLNINQDKVNTIVEVWSTNAKSLIERLKQRTLTSKKLADVNWELYLTTAQSSSLRMKKPMANMELQLETGEDVEKVVLEFTHEELYALYDKLETIQTQLDSLR